MLNEAQTHNKHIYMHMHCIFIVFRWKMYNGFMRWLLGNNSHTLVFIASGLVDTLHCSFKTKFNIIVVDVVKIRHFINRHQIRYIFILTDDKYNAIKLGMLYLIDIHKNYPNISFLLTFLFLESFLFELHVITSLLRPMKTDPYTS